MPRIPSQCRDLADEVRELELLKQTLRDAIDGRPPGGGDRPPDGGGRGGTHPLGGSAPRDGGVVHPQADIGAHTDITDHVVSPKQSGHLERRLAAVTLELRQQKRELDRCLDENVTNVPEEAEEAIAERRSELEEAGLGLGSPEGGVERIDHGGSVWRFEHGHIYWHPSTGANEVRGGILQKYLRLGGPDWHPETGRRELKFPTTGEIRSADDRVPVSHFEEGSIYWVRGTGGAAVFGTVAEHWQRRNGERGPLGYPLTDTHERADGHVTYFERGCVWAPADDVRPVVEFTFHDRPLTGTQTIVDPSDERVSFRSAIRGTVFDAPDVDIQLSLDLPDDGEEHQLQERDSNDSSAPTEPTDIEDNLLLDRPGIDLLDGLHSLGTADAELPPGSVAPELLDSDTRRTIFRLGRELWNGRLVLTPSRNARVDDVPLSTGVASGAGTRLDFRLDVDDVDLLVDGTPYDVSLRLPDGSTRQLFSHAVLARLDPKTVRSDIRFGENEMELIGSVDVRHSTESGPVFRFDPADGSVVVGGDETEGTISVHDADGRERLRFDGTTGDLHLVLSGGDSPESLVETLRDLERRVADLEG